MTQSIDDIRALLVQAEKLECRAAELHHEAARQLVSARNSHAEAKANLDHCKRLYAAAFSEQFL